MKSILVMMALAIQSHAGPVYMVHGTPITKLETIVLLASDSTKKVYRCSEVTLDKAKGTLKTVKK